MLAQINDGCAIRRLVAQCVDPQIALRDLPIALRNRQIAQIHRLRLTAISFKIRAIQTSLNANVQTMSEQPPVMLPNP